MNTSQIYLTLSIPVLLIITVRAFIVGRNSKEKVCSPLTGLASGFVLAGIVFGGDRLIGYALLGVGVVLAIVDMVRRLKERKQSGPISATSG
jgi:hypothetical protein